MRHEKIEHLILAFTAEVEALVRSQMRDEVKKAVDVWLAGTAATPPRLQRPRASRKGAVGVGPARATAPASAAPVPPAAPETPSRRRGWTREAVVAELATWLLTGTVIEAAFLTRQGKPGLVAAARKHFGRFDAALNAANVHLARIHPEGPPTAKRRAWSATAPKSVGMSTKPATAPDEPH